MSLASRVVVDTNVVVSGLRPGSVPRQAIEKVLTEGRILISEAVLAEYDDVLRRSHLDKFAGEADRLRFLDALTDPAELVAVTSTVTDCRDPKDNKFLELALDGRASCLVAGDKHLLALHPFRDIPVLTPRAFLDVLALPPPESV